MGGNFYDLPAANTFSVRTDSLPADRIGISINVLYDIENLDPSDPNGVYIAHEDTEINGKTVHISSPIYYLDRNIAAHELVHATMLATGTLKNGMPQFFTEGIAEVVQGVDDYVSGRVEYIKSFVSDPSILEEALGLGQGTGTSNAYPAGTMFMRFLAKQSLDVTAMVGDSSQAETFSYDTKSAVITNYEEDDTINFSKDVKNYSISDAFNDFQIESSDAGLLSVRDARGKLITLNTTSGTNYAYMAADSGEVNGNNYGGGNNYEILFGANYANNVIRAGNAGSYLWGGKYGNDELYGGSGADTFAYRFEGGNDTVQNAETQDSVVFDDIELNLSQLTAAQINDNGVYLKFSDGGSLTVNGTASSFIVRTDSGNDTYRADYQNKTWSKI